MTAAKKTAAISMPGIAWACAIASRQNPTAGANARPPSLPVSITRSSAMPAAAA